jgi:hypothetical protein
MMDELIFLEAHLSEIFTTAVQDFGKSEAALPSPLTRRVTELKKWVDNPQPVNKKGIALALDSFRENGFFPTFRDLKHVCFGADGVFGNSRLFNILLTEAQNCETGRQFKCFFGLLRSYWAFPLQNETTSGSAREDWKHLGRHLTKRLRELDQAEKRKPAWFQMLQQHTNLLGDNPCDRYGEALLQGDNSEWESVKKGLFIPPDSWVTEEAIIAPIRSAASLGDAAFKKKLEPLLSILEGRAGTSLSKNLSLRCTALLLSRYARCSERPEHPDLRDAALAVIGNPWIKPQAWAAHVRLTNGRPDEEARQMVNGWLKRRLLKDFFEILSDDGVTDQRRLNYWLRFEKAMDDVWIALGSRASDDTRQEVREFRRLAQGRRLHLDGGGSPNNNAFIMRIGKWVAVEFGVTGNACYVYPADPQPFMLTSGGRIELVRLKNKGIGNSYIHNPHGWEEKFDSELYPLFGVWPTEHQNRAAPATSSSSKAQTHSTFHHERPRAKTETAEQSMLFSTSRTPTNDFKDRVLCSDGTCTGVIGPDGRCKTCGKPYFDEKAFDQFVKERSLIVSDNRSKGGALWIPPQLGLNGHDKRKLISWGFQFKPGKGWWWSE